MNIVCNETRDVLWDVLYSKGLYDQGRNNIAFCESPAPVIVPFTSRNLPHDFFFLHSPIVRYMAVLSWWGNRFWLEDMLRTCAAWGHRIPASSPVSLLMAITCPTALQVPFWLYCDGCIRIFVYLIVIALRTSLKWWCLTPLHIQVKLPTSAYSQPDGGFLFWEMCKCLLPVKCCCRF